MLILIGHFIDWLNHELFTKHTIYHDHRYGLFGGRNLCALEKSAKKRFDGGRDPTFEPFDPLHRDLHLVRLAVVHFLVAWGHKSKCLGRDLQYLKDLLLLIILNLKYNMFLSWRAILKWFGFSDNINVNGILLKIWNTLFREYF